MTAALKTPMGGKRWTPEEDAELERLHRAGVEPQAMARFLGRTDKAVMFRLDHLYCMDRDLARERETLPAGPSPAVLWLRAMHRRGLLALPNR